MEKVRGDTKRRLHDCANPFGLILEVEEVELQDLARKIKGKRKGGERREWLAFNCMWALSQMGRKRSRRHVLDFVRMAKEILASISVYSNTSNRGILTFGDGGAWELFKDCPGLDFSLTIVCNIIKPCWNQSNGSSLIAL